MPRDRLDCIVIGYNDLDFQTVVAEARATRGQSPVYNELQRSSARFGGRRLPYMSILNEAIARATGRSPNLNVCNLPCLGVAYLTSFLKKRGFEVEPVNFYSGEREKLEALLATEPRSVAITTTFYVDNAPIIEICKMVREKSPRTCVIVGGPHVFNICSSVDAKTADYVFRWIGGDIYVFDSQGEETLAKILGALRQSDPPALDEIPSLFHAIDGGSFRATARVIEDNDMDANVVDWSNFPQRIYTPTVQMRTARSCAFECAFCRYPAVAGALVLNSVEVLEREFHKLRDAGVRNIVFIDDTFNVPLPRFKKLCRMMIRNRFDFHWYSYFRCSNADAEAFDLLAESGCKGAFLGIESGDQTVLDAMNKSAKLDRYQQGIKKLKERGVTTYASFIVGYPTETAETIGNTIDFIEEAAPDFYSAGVWYFDDKTPVAEMRERFSLKGVGFNWRHATMDWREAVEQANRIYKSVTGPTIMPTYMFDFWSIPYLVGQGVDVEQIRKFCRIVQQDLVRGLDDEIAHTDLETKLDEFFRNGGTPAILPAAAAAR